MTIFNEGLMEYFVHNTDPTYGKVDPAIEALSKYVVPTMYKNLGDGMMIVWEIPSALGLAEQGSLAQEIISVVLHTADRFYWHFRNLSPVELDSYSDQVEKLEIGFGVTKGHAWRLDFGHSLDYAGSIINLASRLETYARPGGVIAQYDVSNWIFDQMVSDGEGHIVDISGIRGYDSPIRSWVNSDVDITQDGFKKIK